MGMHAQHIRKGIHAIGRMGQRGTLAGLLQTLFLGGKDCVVTAVFVQIDKRCQIFLGAVHDVLGPLIRGNFFLLDGQLGFFVTI